MKIKKSRNKKIRIITTLCSIILTSCFLLSTFSFANFSLEEGNFATPTIKNTYKYVPGEIIVKFKDVVTEKQIKSVNSI